MRRFGRWTIRIAFLLLLAGFCWGGWYVYNKGIGKNARDYVIAEFHKRGVEISFRRLTIDPFAGLVARDVVVMDAKNPDIVLAAINRIVLDINYSNLIHHDPFLNAIDLRDANLSLPVNPSDSKSVIQISHLNAHLLLPPHQVYLAEAEALLYGVRISATGRLINPEAFHASAPSSEDEAKKRADMAGVIIGELKKLRFGSAPPSLEIRFSGDLADTDNIFIDATLSGEKIHRGLYRLAGVHAGFHVRAGVFNLKQLTANDGRGTLDTTGSFDSKTGAGEFHIQSSLDAQALLHEFGWTKPLDEMVFYSTPVLDVSGKIERGENLNISFIGGFSLKKFAIRSVIFDGCRANFSWDGTRWFMNDLQVVNRTGELHASAISTTEGFRMKLQSSINPKTFLPLFSGPGAEFLSLWEFDQPPQIQFAMHGPTAEFETCEGEGSIKLGRTRLRGVAMNSATSKIRIKNQAFSCENFKIERQEGSGTGTFVLDLGRKEVRFDHIKARLNPSEAILWVNPDYLEHVVPYRFKKVPNVAVNGVAQFGGGKNTNLEILVDAPDGLDYVFLKRTLSFPKASARLLFTDDHLRISNLAGSVFAGRLRGDVDFSFSRKAPPAYTADIEVENVDFEQLTNLYFNYKDSKGELNGEYKFSGHGGDARRMEGKGTATVTNGNVFAIPILGPLSGLINDVMPGVGYNTARRASVNFDIADGVIHAHDFLVHGGGFSMLGGGDLFFLDDKMNFHVRMNAQGVPGVVLFPVSKLFEYISDGAMSKPLWRPKALSRAVPVEKRQ